MPKLWDETIDAHRRVVRDAVLDATATLVAERGLTGVTMSQIAKVSGIGRATLYKYFPDIESIIGAWHERQIRAHLRQLAEASAAAGPSDRLETVLRTFATQSRRHHDGNDLAALLHQGDHVNRAQEHLTDLVTTLVREAAERGEVRDDVPATELATYCLHALTAASGAGSQAAIERLITVTIAGLRPDREP